MRFGIIGAGAIGAIHAEAIAAMTGGELIGVAGRSAERAVAFAEKHGIRGFQTVAELLACADVDIVTIATPSGAHFEPSMAAIKAGKHVLIEKPLEITIERIDTMIAAAAKHGVTLAAILNRRFTPATSAAKKAADAGRFGKLTSASVYVKWYRSQAYYDSAAWRGTWALDGGGALMNQSIHGIDQLLHLAGPVDSVQAHTACIAHQNIEVEDLAVATLKFKSGALGVVEGTTCAWSTHGHPARIQLGGTEGSVFLADDTLEAWTFMHEQPEDAEIREALLTGRAAGIGAAEPGAIDSDQHRQNFEHVVQAIDEGRMPATSGAEARKAVALICAIYESARNGGSTVTIS
ncbi:MAG TPA: oxidoreductase [Lentisphaeria bacterium]|nr:oxidoreductase [Lentisphaeria bacterium]